MRWLVTGYGPFEDVTDNVTMAVAPLLGHPFQILDVSYDAVDRFLESLDPSSFDAMLSLGHANRETLIRVETRGRNAIGPRPGIDGTGRVSMLIDPDGPKTISARLFANWGAVSKIASPKLSVSENAGDYLCNYILYRSAQLFPNKLTGFLHLPPGDVIAPTEQATIIRGLMDARRAQHIR